MADEVHRIIVQAVGEDELHTLQAAVDASKKILADAVATASKFGPAFAQSSPAVRQAAIELKQFEDSLKQSQRTLASSGVQVGGLTQSLTTLGFVANDVDQFNVSFAAGIRSISNNIPQLTYAAQNLATVGFKGIMTALTGPAGIIIGFSALASLLPLIQAGWGKLEDAWSGGATETEAERMDKLAKATARTADETDRLNKYRKEQSIGERLATGEPEVLSRRRQVVEKAVIEAGFPGLAEAVVQSRFPQGISNPEIETLRHDIQVMSNPQTDQQRQDIKLLESTGAITPFTRQKSRERLIELEEEERQKQLVQARADITRAVANPDEFGGIVDRFRLVGLTETAEAVETALAKDVSDRIYKVSETLSKALKKAKDVIQDKADELYEESVKLDKLTRLPGESDRHLKERERRAKEARELEAKELEDYIRQDEIDNERRLRISEQRKKEFQKEYEEEQKEIGKASGLDILAKQAALGGASVVEISEYFRRTSGVDTVTAAEFAVGGSQAAQRELIEKQLNPKLRPSEIVSDIHSSIQQGIGDKEESERQQQHLEVAREMRNALVSINQNTKRDYAGRPIQTRRFF